MVENVPGFKKRRRVYVDTSVVGGCLDKEFAQASVALFDAFRAGVAVVLVSDILDTELGPAPKGVRDILRSVPDAHTERVELTQEARGLAEMYFKEGVISPKHVEDAWHIATATVNHADALVSWNFKHMVNLDRIHGYNAVNLKHDYPFIEIRTPAEVLDYGNQSG